MITLRHIFLFGLLCLTVSLTAQVGVNKPDPEQTLDVNGKVRIGNDGTAPSEGTIRYNDAENTFEGFTNEGWQNLAGEEGAPAPDGVRPAILYEFGALADSDWKLYDLGTVYPSGASVDSIVPAGQYFVVDRIYCTGNSFTTNKKFRAGVRMATANGGGFNPQLYFTGSTESGTVQVVANKAPLLVIQPGRKLEVFNDRNSETTVRIVVHGFYVTDLDDYFNY